MIFEGLLVQYLRTIPGAKSPTWEAPLYRKLKFVNRYLFDTGELYMAKQKSTGRKKVDFGDFRFASSNLDASQKKAFKAWIDQSDGDIPVILHSHLSAGYKITLNYDLNSDTVVCVSTSQYQDMPDAGLQISARHEEPYAALCIALFKWAIICKGVGYHELDEDGGWG